VIKKVAIVTGSSKGIGIVLVFARSKKYSGIIVNARRIEEAQSVTYDIEKSYSS
jgi:NAD(P)-dependent dehydrogenase (short-subunit alcohol dehydrogenase family)